MHQNLKKIFIKSYDFSYEIYQFSIFPPTFDYDSNNNRGKFIIDIMSTRSLWLNIDHANKLNRMMPKGYKLITKDDFKKRQNKKRKVTYVFAEVQSKPSEAMNLKRRNKSTISYKEEPIMEEKLNEEEDFNFSQLLVTEKIQPPPPRYIQPPPPQIEQKPPSPPPIEPLTTKQIIVRLKQHTNYYIILQYRDDQFANCTIDQIQSKTESSSYSLFDLENDLKKLFLKMYEFYPRTSIEYSNVAQLEKYLISMIRSQKTQIKQPQIKEEFFPPMEINRTVSQASNLLNRKKNLLSKDIKSITIMDKRMLGQNIKKLPSEYLPDICKIVFDTLETRQQYVIDIDTLPLKKVRELQIYVDDCLQKIGEFQSENNLRNEGYSEESSFIIEDDYD